MKVAVTADLHLNPEFSLTKMEYPKISPELYAELDSYGQFRNNFLRWLVLEEILENCRKEGINNFIIAGDLFDEKTGLIEIDYLFSRYRDISIHIIRGNHDDFLSKKYFSSSLDNVFVYDEPTVKIIDEVAFVFIPYQEGSSLVEEFNRIKDSIQPKQKFVLISHSDITAECYDLGKEKKVYFPISRKDLNSIKPSLVILGHIHQPPREPIYHNIFYPGSPCACDTNETEIRSYIILDLSTPLIPENVIRKKIKRGIIFYEKDLVVVPHKDETKFIEEQLKMLLYSLAIDIGPKIPLVQDKEKDRFEMAKFEETGELLKHKVCLKINVKGLTYEGKEFVERKIIEFLDKKILDKTISTENLRIATNQDICFIAKEISEEIDKTFYSLVEFKGYKDAPIYKVSSEDHKELLTKSLQIITEI